VLNANIALQRIWYVLSKFQKKASSRSCKTPHNHHHSHRHHHCFCPPCCSRKKLTLIAPLNNDKCLGEHFFSLSLTSHRHNARPWNGRPQLPWPNFRDECRTMILPSGGQTVLYKSLTWRTGNSEMFPSGLCLPFLPAHSTCRTRLSHWFNFRTTYVAPLLITPKTVAIHPTSSTSSLPQKASPPVMQSCLLPPPWPSCSSPPTTTHAATIVVTLTPLGLTTGKVISQVISWTPTLVGQAMTQATLTPLGLAPGRATGLTV
jgi:hypothetical protein